VRRNPKKGRYDPVEAILDRAVIAHVAFVDRGEAVCIPMLFGRVERSTAGCARGRRMTPLDTERVESLSIQPQIARFRW
jgi:nitroimidazol reductase NimA-like FMN-containing flavoprotein (pyridoxamine 5'-phosphate oxidase superfamily)